MANIIMGFLADLGLVPFTQLYPEHIIFLVAFAIVFESVVTIVYFITHPLRD